jgi:hypothetical protein
MDQTELEVFFRFVITVAAEDCIRLLGILAEDDYCIPEMASLLDLEESVIAFNLSQLIDLNLVSARVRQGEDYYHLETDALRRVVAALPTSARVAVYQDSARTVRVAAHVDTAPDDEAWERKVRQTFFVGNRLAMIPDNAKSRRAVLKSVAAQFEEGVRYPEAMFELLLKNIYPDTATLRRELLGHGLIKHDHGSYVRPPTKNHM